MHWIRSHLTCQINEVMSWHVALIRQLALATADSWYGGGVVRFAAVV